MDAYGGPAGRRSHLAQVVDIVPIKGLTNPTATCCFVNAAVVPVLVIPRVQALTATAKGIAAAGVRALLACMATSRKSSSSRQLHQVFSRFPVGRTGDSCEFLEAFIASFNEKSVADTKLSVENDSSDLVSCSLAAVSGLFSLCCLCTGTQGIVGLFCGLLGSQLTCPRGHRSVTRDIFFQIPLSLKVGHFVKTQQLSRTRTTHVQNGSTLPELLDAFLSEERWDVTAGVDPRFDREQRPFCGDVDCLRSKSVCASKQLFFAKVSCRYCDPADA